MKEIVTKDSPETEQSPHLFHEASLMRQNAKAKFLLNMTQATRGLEGSPTGRPSAGFATGKLYLYREAGRCDKHSVARKGKFYLTHSHSLRWEGVRQNFPFWTLFGNAG